ncbi:hypothetical protein niasHS_006211 [Heterodera schachtii]|uniref:B30.2/SPRY domain-containing protein n=1 Tax=Heterodera schachtii TaxID=97005 RepID=A0ABD2JSI5_HETSC
MSSAGSTNGLQMNDQQQQESVPDSDKVIRQLRAKISELEATNLRMSSSTASFDVFSSPNGDEANDSFEGQNEQNGGEHNDKRIEQLEKRMLQTENNHQQLLTENNSMREKMAQMEKEQRKMADRQQNDLMSLCAKFEALKQKQTSDSEQMDTVREEILVKIDELVDLSINNRAFRFKFAAMENIVGVLKDRFEKKLLNAVHPNFRGSIAEVFTNPAQNCWDANACHNDLTLIGADSLIVRYKAEGNNQCALFSWPWRSVFAKCAIPSIRFGIFFYEVKIMNMKNYIRIGFATKHMPLDKGVGDCPATYSYDNATHFFFCGTKIGGNRKFHRDDVIGCGVNLVTGRIIFTKNGQRLDTADLFASPPIDQLFPCVSLLDPSDMIEANFGPTFKFNPANV